MYRPRPFVPSSATADALLRAVVSGQLITATAEGPLATLVPWVVDVDAATMLGHLARPNPQWQTPWLGQALVVADGPQGYVSPSWYAAKATHGRVVPTWDYVVVQVRGELVVHDDAGWVEDVVRRLTARQESGRVEPWQVDDAPVDYLAGQLRGIVGVELHIADVEVAVKMSQNKSEDDVAAVAAGLESDGNACAAAWVRDPRTGGAPPGLT